MRIGVQTWGSEGDIRPLLALAGGLSAAGHDVVIAITELDDRDYTHYADALGIDVRMVASPVLSSADEMAAIGERLLALGDPYRQGRLIATELFEPLAPQMFEASERLAADCDLLVRHFFHYPAGAAAELAGIPGVSVSFSPDMVPSSALPPSGLPNLGSAANRLFWRAAEAVMRRSFLVPVNELRSAAGLAPFKRATDAWYSRQLNLLAASPVLAPPAPDRDERHAMCGFLNLPEPARVDPLPSEVETFLDAGEPPVFIGFGSLMPRGSAHRDETRRLIDGALAAAGCRAIVQGLGGETSERVLHAGRLPHADVLPRCAAAVHHAGAGTTQTVLTAGIPSVPVPHLADQFFWASRLHRLGAASRPVKRQRLTAPRLASRIRRTLADPRLRERARSLGAQLAGEDGLAAAVDLICRIDGANSASAP